MASDTEAEILMRVGNTRPQLEATLTDEEGDPVDLTNADVVVVVVDTFLVEQWRGTATTDPDQENNTGQLSYAWRTDDVATPGNYGLYFEVTFDTGDVTDYPTGGPLSFVVAEMNVGNPYLADIPSLARRVGIAGGDLTDNLRLVLQDMVEDVQADVEGYLRRPITATRFTELARPDYRERCGFDLRFDPVQKILAADGPDPATGLWTVQYVAGIDNPIALKAITRYVYASAMDAFAAHPVYGRNYRAIKTLSAGGRSLTYDDPSAQTRRASATLPAYPQPGASPSIETLAAWRRRGVFSRPRFVAIGEMTDAGWMWGSGVYTYVAGGDGDLFVGDARTGEIGPAAP
jgi:hypothetical protein